MQKYLAKFWRNDGKYHSVCDVTLDADGKPAGPNGYYTTDPYFIFNASDDESAKKLAIAYSRKRHINLKEDCWLRKLWRRSGQVVLEIKVTKKEIFDGFDEAIDPEMLKGVADAGFNELFPEDYQKLLLTEWGAKKE